jgi:hypothetical protein
MQSANHPFRLFAHLVLVACFAGNLASCSQGSSYDATGHPVPFRYASAVVQAYSSNDGPSMRGVKGAAPCLVGAIADASNDFNPKTGVVLTRLEIDFGDGGGWQDVTAAQPSWDYYVYDGIDQDKAVLHTYTTPGVYRVRSRGTYWDGEVVTSNHANGEEPTVTVLAAP